MCALLALVSFEMDAGGLSAAGAAAADEARLRRGRAREQLERARRSAGKSPAPPPLTGAQRRWAQNLGERLRRLRERLGPPRACVGVGYGAGLSAGLVGGLGSGVTPRLVLGVGAFAGVGAGYGWFTGKVRGRRAFLAPHFFKS